MFASVALDDRHELFSADTCGTEPPTMTSKWGALLLDVSEGTPKIIHCCDTICDYTGFTQEELLDQTFSALNGPETSIESIEMLEFLIANTLAGIVNFTHYRKDGSAFDHRLKVTPLKDSDDQLTAWLVEANYVEKISWLN